MAVLHFAKPPYFLANFIFTCFYFDMEINFKASIKATKALTPKTLLKTVQRKGCFPNYRHDVINDKVLCELNMLAEKYRQTLSLEDKIKLIHYEQNMLYDELQNPELTLARNYEEIKNMDLTKDNKKNILDILTLFNLNALRRIEFLDKPFETDVNSKKINILEKFYQNINPDNWIKISIKDLLKEMCDGFLLMNKKNEENFKQNEPEIDLTNGDPKVLHKFFVDDKLNQAQIEIAKDLILKILKDKDSSLETLYYATWAGGKYKNDEIFEQLKSILFDEKEDDIRKKELALHSVSLYAREKFEEVETILDKLSDDKDFPLQQLAIIIYNKLHGVHHNTFDRELLGLDNDKKAEFKNLRDKFVVSDAELDARKINGIDRGLYPFRNILDKFVEDFDKKVYILDNDSYTKYNPSLAGIRAFKMGLENSGDFYDSIFNVDTKDGTFISNDIETIRQYNSISHECAHMLHRHLSQELCDEIEYLYQKAIEENRILDRYAGTNSKEYFAQGFEAYTSVYKPHKYLMENDSWDNTVYKLIQKDPELYDFINYLVNDMN